MKFVAKVFNNRRYQALLLMISFAFIAPYDGGQFMPMAGKFLCVASSLVTACVADVITAEVFASSYMVSIYLSVIGLAVLIYIFDQKKNTLVVGYGLLVAAAVLLCSQSQFPAETAISTIPFACVVFICVLKDLRDAW